MLFMYQPVYIGWRSPWYWGYYPPYWRPWRPFYWHQYYTYHYYWDYYYFGHYRRWHYYRFPGWRNRYYGNGGFRRRAPIYQTRLQRGDFRTTYSRPDLAREGSAMFKRDHPKAPSVNNKLPAFDNGGRPVMTRPAVTRPTRPGTTTLAPPGLLHGPPTQQPDR
ncbi:hypothetical protein [Paraflavitalea speifideaquila]|uniref:hypothetical protein n=1 Tax=Paraflavitalea speifideaquila TaxID=3076558 RepID=UPI0028E413F3|nr:hypothetical protein [Paraflavitalea speifideiaquila]